MQYDIITIGGGLGGASLAKVMAERGSRILVIERETAFRMITPTSTIGIMR